MSAASSALFFQTAALAAPSLAATDATLCAFFMNPNMLVAATEAAADTDSELMRSASAALKDADRSSLLLGCCCCCCCCSLSGGGKSAGGGDPAVAAAAWASVSTSARSLAGAAAGSAPASDSSREAAAGKRSDSFLSMGKAAMGKNGGEIPRFTDPLESSKGHSREPPAELGHQHLMSMSFPWREDREPARGRLLRASRAVAAGACVLREAPYALVALGALRSALCAVCLRAADPDECCDDCGAVFFCGAACRERLRAVHEKECAALEEVELAASKAAVEPDLLRLLLRVLAARALDSQPQEVATNEAGAAVASFAKVRAMTHALDQLPQAWKDRVRDGARRVMEDLPDDCLVPVEDVLVLAAQINENAYSLNAQSDVNLVASVGLFPVMGLVNHSCAPNCGWSNAGDGSVAVHALRDLEEGEEITLSYIDVDKERAVRRQELRETKHFDCHCERCSVPLEESPDRFLEGLLCPRCPLADESLLTTSEDKLSCPRCHLDFSAATVNAEVGRSREAVQWAKQQVEQQQLGAAISALSGVLSGVSVAGVRIPFHPSHAVAIPARRALAEAHFKLGELEQALVLRQQAVEAVARVASASHLPLAVAHLDLADTIRRLTAQLAAPLAAHLDREALLRAMRESYRAAQGICDVALPSAHPLRQLAASSAQR